MGFLAAMKRKFFSYDAVEDTGRRRVRSISLQSEDKELTSRLRGRLVSNSRDLARNMSIAAWALRKHLDYVSTFTFQCRSEDKQLNGRVEELMNWYSRPLNCDVAKRHSLAKMIRLGETRRTQDGDILLLKLRDGRMQAIESDRVRTPKDNLPRGFEPERWIHGVETAPTGEALRYAICDRTGKNGFSFNRAVPARFAFHFGYFDRFDQVRGVSPLVSALNTFNDVYECAEYALAKMKVSQLFGLKFKRGGSDPLTDDDNSRTPYGFNFGKGPQALDLDAGDDAEFMESKTPSAEFAAYMERMIAAALKSLDIPYSFFDESFTNYSGARQALLQYELSAEDKRRDVKELLNRITAWRLGLFIDDGILQLPAGMQLFDLQWDWLATGMPWIDPLKETTADIARVQAGLDSPQRVCRRRGEDFFEIVDEIKTAQEYVKEQGVQVAYPELKIGINVEERDETGSR